MSVFHGIERKTSNALYDIDTTITFFGCTFINSSLYHGASYIG